MGTKFTDTSRGFALDSKFPVETSAAAKGYATGAAILGALKGYLFGLTLSNNGSDATNDIDFAAGQCADSTGVVLISCSARTKRLDATFTAGTNQGGLDTGSVADGFYHCFAIRKDSDGTGDFLFSTSATAPTMPAGYTYFRRIGSIYRASSALVAFAQVGDRFEFAVPLNIAATLNPTDTAATISTYTPTGVVMEAIISVTLSDLTPAADTFALITALDTTDTAPSATLRHVGIIGDADKAAITDQNSVVMTVRTNTSGQFRRRVTGSTTDTTIQYTQFGWIDYRGRLA